MKKLLALLVAVSLTFQLVTPVFAEEIEETQTATEAAEMEAEAPTTEIPTTEPTTTDTMETAAPEETSAPTEPQPTTEGTEATETTASTEETTLDLLSEDENVIASGECGAQGDNLTWVLTANGTLTISGNGRMENYSYAQQGTQYRSTAPWGTRWNRVLSLRIESGVTSIGNAAFFGCSSLTSTTISEGVTSIGSWAFYSCGLTYITLPTSIEGIGTNAFSSCSDLKDIYYCGSIAALKRMTSNINLPADCILHGATSDVDNGSCGDRLAWTLSTAGILTISGSGDMRNYSDSTSNGAP